LYEASIAACHEKAKEIDDSGGWFGFFVISLLGAWARARDASGAEPAETVAKLVQWMEQDPYGFCSRLEETITAEMSERSLEEPARVAGECFESSAPDDGGAVTEMLDSRGDLAGALSRVERGLFPGGRAAPQRCCAFDLRRRRRDAGHWGATP
jgi:hypothetical protein